jgi:hypothetical protein
MTSSNSDTYKLTDILEVISVMFADIAKGVAKKNPDGVSKQILEAVKTAANNSKTVNDFAENLKKNVANINPNELIHNIDGLSEYASILSQLQKEKIDWTGIDKGFTGN